MCIKADQEFSSVQLLSHKLTCRCESYPGLPRGDENHHGALGTSVFSGKSEDAVQSWVRGLLLGTRSPLLPRQRGPAVNTSCSTPCQAHSPVAHVSARVCAQWFSPVQLFGTPWTAALQAPCIHSVFQARVLEWGAIAFSGSNSRQLQIRKKKSIHRGLLEANGN